MDVKVGTTTVAKMADVASNQDVVKRHDLPPLKKTDHFKCGWYNPDSADDFSAFDLNIIRVLPYSIGVGKAQVNLYQLILIWAIFENSCLQTFPIRKISKYFYRVFHINCIYHFQCRISTFNIFKNHNL